MSFSCWSAVGLVFSQQVSGQQSCLWQHTLNPDIYAESKVVHRRGTMKQASGKMRFQERDCAKWKCREKGRSGMSMGERKDMAGRETNGEERTNCEGILGWPKLQTRAERVYFTSETE